MVTVGERVRRCRTAKGMSLQDVANKCGVTRQYLSLYELNQDNVRLSLPMIERIAAAIGVSPSELLGWENDAEVKLYKEEAEKYKNGIKEVLDGLDGIDEAPLVCNESLYGDRIKFYREQAGMSMSELSRRADVNFTTLRKYERNEGEATPSIIAKIATALKVSPSILLGWETPKENDTKLNEVYGKLKKLLDGRHEE